MYVEAQLSAANTTTWNILEYLIVMILSIALALMVSLPLPSSVLEGRYVFVVPVATEIWAVALSKNSKEAVDFFYAGSGPMSGEASWALVLITLPTWGCCWYSVVMYWRRTAMNARTQRNSTDSNGSVA